MPRKDPRIAREVRITRGLCNETTRSASLTSCLCYSKVRAGPDHSPKPPPNNRLRRLLVKLGRDFPGPGEDPRRDSAT